MIIHFLKSPDFIIYPQYNYTKTYIYLRKRNTFIEILIVL